VKESSQVAEIAERVLFGLNPKIEMVPVITAEDLQNDFSGVRGSIQLTADNPPSARSINS